MGQVFLFFLSTIDVYWTKRSLGNNMGAGPAGYLFLRGPCLFSMYTKGKIKKKKKKIGHVAPPQFIGITVYNFSQTIIFQLTYFDYIK